MINWILFVRFECRRIHRLSSHCSVNSVHTEFSKRYIIIIEHRRLYPYDYHIFAFILWMSVSVSNKRLANSSLTLCSVWRKKTRFISIGNMRKPIQINTGHEMLDIVIYIICLCNHRTIIMMSLMIEHILNSFETTILRGIFFPAIRHL